jgi:hypothetical protein
MKITERFLKAKHWQLFVLLVGVPIFLNIFMMISMVIKLSSGSFENSSFHLFFFPFFFFIMLFFGWAMFRWQWSIAIGLQHKLPSNFSMNVKLFKFFFFFPIFYISSILLVVSIIMFSGGFEDGGVPNFGLIFTLFGIVFLLHFFSMFCLMYSLYFVSKTIASVELQREALFSDYIADFFLIWFFPVGIWFIQPRINKIIESNQTEEEI